MFLLQVFVVFLATSSNIQAQVYPATQLCERLKKDTKQSKAKQSTPIQGLFLVNQEVLYFFARDNVFKVHFTGDFINSIHGQVALFDRKSEKVEPLGQWSKQTWLRTGEVNDSEATLKMINTRLYPKEGVFVDIFMESNGVLKRIWYENSTSSVTSVTDKVDEQMLYALLSSGRAVYPADVPRELGPELSDISTDFFIRMVNGTMVAQMGNVLQKDSTFATIGPHTLYTHFDEEKFILYTEYATPLGPSQGKKYKPPVEIMPAFGFTFASIVHLWDVHNRRVILFDHPMKRMKKEDLHKLGNYAKPDLQNIQELIKIFNKSYPVTVIQFSEYFACSEKEWLDKTLWFGWVSWVVIPGIIVVVICCCFWSNCIDDDKGKSVKRPKRGLKRSIFKQTIRSASSSRFRNTSKSNVPKSTSERVKSTFSEKRSSLKSGVGKSTVRSKIVS